MKVLLIFPPQCRPLHPYLSLAVVKAELQRRGHECRILDLNLRFYEHILNRETLATVAAELRELVCDRDNNEVLEGRDALIHYRQATAVVRSEYLVEQIEPAVQVMRSGDFYDFGQFLWARKVIEESLDLYSSRFGLTEIGYSHLRMRYSTADPEQIMQAIEDCDENPFAETVNGWAIESIEDFEPDAVGISIAFDEQLIAAFTLAKGIREATTAPLFAGGSMVTRLRDQIGQAGQLSTLFDQYLPFESEAQFGDIVDRMAGREPEPHGDPRALLPDFSDFSLGRYYLPEVILPYIASRGCSFGRCVYCSHYMTYGRYAYGDAAQTAVHMQILSERYGSRHIHFVDEAMEPRFAADLSAALGELEVDLNWMVFARAHKQWTQGILENAAKAGCRRLIFGIDSATDRIQVLMGKNTNLSNASDILAWCANYKIAAQVNFIVGFPGETEEEAREIVNFVTANIDSLKTVGVSFAVSNFAMVSEAPWDKMAAKVDVDPARQFAIYHTFQPDSGLDMAEAATLAQEIQTEADRLTAASTRYPLLREMAFLYNAHYRGEEPVRTDSAPVATSGPVWLCHDLFALNRRITVAREQLTPAAEEYLSQWHRLASETSITSRGDGAFGYQVETYYSDRTFELPVVEAFLIGDLPVAEHEASDGRILSVLTEGAY